MKHKQVLRLAVQLILAAGITFLFLRQDYSQAGQPLFTWIGWADPLQGFAAFLKRHWPYLALLSLATLGGAVFFGRIFCGWICPIGAILDLTALGKRFLRLPNYQPGPKTKRFLDWFRWLILGGVFGLLWVGWSITLTLNPFSVWPRDVYRLLNGWIPWSIGIFIIAGLVAFPRFWCRFLCPAGSLFNLTGRLGTKRYIIKEGCKQCGRCIKICPMENISLCKKPAAKGEKTFGRSGPDCLHCSQCVQSCSGGYLVKQRAAPEVFNEGRRDFFTAAAFGIGTLGIAWLGKRAHLDTVSATPRRLARFLRPPGALPEESFNMTCDRCGQCLQVCPTKVLVPAGLEAGLEGLWTPRFVPCRGPVPGRCMFCMACGQVCPTQALAPVPLETVRLGRPVINHSTCLAWGKGTKCLLCVETCPKFAIGIDAMGRPVIDLQKCNGCGSCEAHCPVAGSAVILTNAGETRRAGTALL